jgi:prepilin peptidase CpaA
MTSFLSITVFPVLMIVAGAGDALTLRIPNWLTAGAVFLFFPMAALTGMPLVELSLHLAVGAALFAVGFMLFTAGLFGGGDAKLLAAAALWFGWPQLVPFLVLTVFAGGILALCVGLWSLVMLAGGMPGASLKERFKALKPNVPYGYAFAIGAILAFPDSWWMRSVG